MVRERRGRRKRRVSYHRVNGGNGEKQKMFFFFVNSAFSVVKNVSALSVLSVNS
jgi:hypothetical protein